MNAIYKNGNRVSSKRYDMEGKETDEVDWRFTDENIGFMRETE